jgi:hypothetical protein
MDRKDIVKKFYEKGILLSPKELQGISEENPAHPENSPVARADSRGVVITPAPRSKRKKLSAQDFTEYYNKKYELVRDMLLKRMDVVSMTNAKTDPSPCGIIGIVKDITQRGFMFEDPTGELEVVKSGIAELDQVNPDDVFGLKGFVREGRFFPKEIVWPEIPLNHRIGRIRGAVAMLSGRENSILVTADRPKTKKTIKITNPPEWITITRGEEGIAVLVLKTSNTKKEDALLFLKKRSLPETNPMKTPPLYLIEGIPDIIWLIQDQEWTETHRGITIISSGRKSLVGIDLETRKTESRPHATPSGP